DIIQLPVPDNFYCSVVHPHIVVTTKESRSVLPNQITLSTAITQWGNLGGLVAGFYKSDVKLIGRAMKDVVAEPHRKQFIPGFDALKEKLLAEGALCMNISGSGPSVFALSEDKKTAEKIGEIMKLHFKEQGIDSNIYVMKVSDKGAKTI
ncbi:MAG: homoserine kinase, partial [Tidjanibacter sp.]|nr:homoserine kinase [Tidjanibacter sp.]